MSEQSTVPPEAQEPQFRMVGDIETNPNVLFLEIPVGKVADGGDDAFIYLLGFFEDAKRRAIGIVNAKRKAKQEGHRGILTPGRGTLHVQ